MPKPLDDYTKQDWLAANTHGNLTPNLYIYRIFRTDHLLNDIRNGTNTLVNPCYETQFDRLENPLKNAQFKFEGRRYALLQDLMAEYYTQSWSLSRNGWGAFGGGRDTIRIKCNIGALFERLVDEKDPFYSLYYHMGLISYEDPKVIRDEINNSDFSDFLDSAGYGLLKTVLRIRTDFQKEEEVRLVYVRSPRGENTYPLKHHVFGDQNQFCAHKFNWDGLIVGYEFNPQNRDDSVEIATAINAVLFKT